MGYCEENPLHRPWMTPVEALCLLAAPFPVLVLGISWISQGDSVPWYYGLLPALTVGFLLYWSELRWLRRYQEQAPERHRILKLELQRQKEQYRINHQKLRIREAARETEARLQESLVQAGAQGVRVVSCAECGTDRQATENSCGVCELSREISYGM